MCDPPAKVDGFPLVKVKSIMYNDGLDYYGNAVAGETAGSNKKQKIHTVNNHKYLANGRQQKGSNLIQNINFY